ncbi:MAG: glycoside hydrolase family 2 [Planctomycetes bacterium]|nr:glycoside hydrolase family 2 [Planctomycetota bacterium]
MLRIVLAVTVALSGTLVAAAQWHAQEGPLMTRWTKDVTPTTAHPEYPRPQMVRPAWQNLNGLWDYALRPKAEGRPDGFDGQILVPFPLESALSGVMKRLDENQRLWYRRTVELPADWTDQRVLLHFGAVDWEATVWVNGSAVGSHRGGYDPFSFDVTDALQQTGPQEIVVAVWDPTDAGYQARGKQVRKPGSIWYTPSTGIWQTVWLEPVPESHIGGIKLTPDIDHSRLLVEVDVPNLSRSHGVDVVVLDDGREIARANGARRVAVDIPNPRLWSPDDPFLYGLRITLRWFDNPERVIDQVTSYFGMRQVSVGPDERGVTRLLLNHKPLFMFGPLDQGFWPDGLYAAPTDAALRYDVEVTRQLGFNMARKHVKIEPARWYYWCDKLGLMVWQDMPSGDKYIGSRDPDFKRSPESATQFDYELRRLIETHYNHPSIVMWVIFNEGWGQSDTQRLAEWVRTLDPTRLVNSASGWTDRGVGDVHDIHAYPGPGSPQPEPKRAAVLGEFGGLGLPLAGHTWQAEKNWGYRSFKTRDELTEAYLDLVERLRPLTGEPGLSAAVYTQTTDVEIEVNGLLTYDRELVKMDIERITAANRTLYLPPPLIKRVVPTSEEKGIVWRYVTETPADNWYQPNFDDSSWAQGPGGFGREGTPGAVVGTAWHTPDVWLRRTFELTRVPANPRLRLYHDEDCTVLINGRRVASVKGYTTSYVLISLEDEQALRVGKNLLAVHCHQTDGGQGVDVGLVELVDRP